MAAWLQQLLDDLTTTAGTERPLPTIEDTVGALGHLGRAFTRLAQDGLTEAGGPRERNVAGLGAACTAAGSLWPVTRGPLTDLAGAAADLIGRERDGLGRSHRWAITVELAAPTDRCAQVGHLLLPHAAVAELTAVRRLAAAVERDALVDPPLTGAAAILDWVVPASGAPRQAGDVTAAEATATLIATLGRAQRDGELALRDFRASVGAAMVASRHAANFAAALVQEPGRPWEATAAAWRATGQATMAFEDGRRRRSPDPRGVAAWAQAVVDVLAAGPGREPQHADTRAQTAITRVGGGARELANQIPLLADRLAAVLADWARTGQLYAYGRDLPPMEDMPEGRVRDVIAGRRVQALGADLDRLGHVVSRAGALSTALADALNRAAPSAPAVQRHLSALYAQRTRAPGAAERLLEHAQAVERALAASRTPLHPGHPTPGGPPLPGR